MDHFWKTDQIVKLGLFHFFGPANGHTHTFHIHSTITRLGGLVCYSRASFANPVSRNWDNGTHGGTTGKAWGQKFTQVMGRCLLCHSCMFGPIWLAPLGPIASPNNPNESFNLLPASLPPPPPAPPLPSPHPLHLTHSYNVPPVILQWFWKKLLKFQ